MEAALYGGGGFFASGHGAGRSGRDFVTSPETGSLFGACVARAIDRLWEELGEPDPFLVIEAGAGNGRLATDILRAQPECMAALRYLLVERSPAARLEQRRRLPIEPPDEALGPFVERDDTAVPVPGSGPVVAALDDLPALSFDGVVLANELLDNLPFGVAEFDGTRWNEIRVGLDGDRFVEVVVPLRDPHPTLPPAPPAGARVPVPTGLDAWFAHYGAVLRHGRMLLIDYVVPLDALMTRSPEWLRTYRGHTPGSSPLDAPGTQDITADVAEEQLHHAAREGGFDIVTEVSQAEWLQSLGIDELVEAGRRAWHDGAERGDLDALAGRSRVSEAAALTDHAGLGAYRVIVLSR